MKLLETEEVNLKKNSNHKIKKKFHQITGEEIDHN